LFSDLRATLVHRARIANDVTRRNRAISDATVHGWMPPLSMSRSLLILLTTLLALTGPAHGERVDWSPYLEKPSDRPQKTVKPVKASKASIGKAKPKAKVAKAKRRR
jgi:hypothetical protein